MIDFSQVQDAVAWGFVLLGVGFVILAAVGILKFPDSLTRMAAGSKATTLGLMLAVIGAMLHSSSQDSRFILLMGLLMIFITSPVAAHLLGRAALRAGLRVVPKTQGIENLKALVDSKSNTSE